MAAGGGLLFIYRESLRIEIFRFSFGPSVRAVNKYIYIISIGTAPTSRVHVIQKIYRTRINLSSVDVHY